MDGEIQENNYAHLMIQEMEQKKEEEEGIEHDQIEPTIPVDTSTDKPIEPEKEEAPPVVVNDNNEEKKEEEQTEEHNENQ